MKKQYFTRTRLANDIVCEVVFPERQTGRVALVCPGAPSEPPKTSVLAFLAKKGYVAFGVRYRGTWESDGVFLKKSPAKDVKDCIDYLIKQKCIVDMWTQESILLKVNRIDLFGGSFGGPAVLLNSKHPQVHKVIALAPVLDMHRCGPEETFEEYVRTSIEGFGGVYRVERVSDWQKLLRQDFYNPITMLEKIDTRKCFIFQCADDMVCPVENTKDFVGETGVEVYYKPKGGHMGTGRIAHQFYWKKIEAFLKKKS